MTTRTDDDTRLEGRLALAIAGVKRVPRSAAVLAIRVHARRGGSPISGADVDAVRLQAMSRLHAALAPTDAVHARGGLEFVVVLERLEKGPFFVHVADELLQVLSRPYQGLKQLDAVASIGISLCPDDGDTPAALIRAATAAVEGAAGAGGNLFGFQSATSNQAAMRRLQVERGLRGALERGEFSLRYQPQVDNRSGTVLGAETLLRWETTLPGGCGPAEFVPLLEDSGLVAPVGAWVLQEACRQGAAWRKQGHPLRLSVNISAKQLAIPGLEDQVHAALQNAGLPPSLLEVELTESVMVEDAHQARARLEKMRKLGVRVAVDDFGTGYASLSYIRHFPMDTLKIDRQFIKGLPMGHENAAISSAIIALARSLRLEVVAEGVEQEAEEEFLRSVGCHVIQGYRYSKPLTAPELEAWRAARPAAAPAARKR
ncbi:MAG: EAL domain-containing protein [Deltaproteobacteria bacterium]|nr:EAL domain-containing protein [Deltaproteobacteria bacterium]